MSNIFASNYKLQKKIKSIYLTNYKYYEYIGDNIILLNSNLCTKQDVHVQFYWSDNKTTLKRKQTYLT